MTKQAKIFVLIYIACSLMALAWSSLHNPSASGHQLEATEKSSSPLAIIVNNT